MVEIESGLTLQDAVTVHYKVGRHYLAFPSAAGRAMRFYCYKALLDLPRLSSWGTKDHLLRCAG